MKATRVKTKWANDMAGVLQRTAEGLLNAKEDGVKNIIVQKSAAVATTMSLTGIAKVFGTAKTGVAISALSGAAARSAIVAWFGGGSMLIGGSVIAALALGGGWLGWWLLIGAERKPEDLNKNEKSMFSRCQLFSGFLLDQTNDKKSALHLTPRKISALQMLKKDINNYLKYGCNQSRHVRNRTEKNLEEMSKLLDALG